MEYEMQLQDVYNAAMVAHLHTCINYEIGLGYSRC